MTRFSGGGFVEGAAELGYEQALEALLGHGRDGALDDLLLRIEEEVRQFRGGQEAADDATLLAVRLGGTSGCNRISGTAA